MELIGIEPTTGTLRIRRGGLSQLPGQSHTPQSPLNGADRDRTDDLYVANVPLSQLSYSPILYSSRRRADSNGACKYITSAKIGKLNAGPETGGF